MEGGITHGAVVGMYRFKWWSNCCSTLIAVMICDMR